MFLQLWLMQQMEGVLSHTFMIIRTVLLYIYMYIVAVYERTHSLTCTVSPHTEVIGLVWY